MSTSTNDNLRNASGAVQPSPAATEQPASPAANEQPPSPAANEQPPSPAAIELRDVSFGFTKSAKILRNVSFSIKPGEKVAVLGANGAGKTTLMLHLNGILLPDQGGVYINGTKLSKSTNHEARRKVGMVFQDPDDQLFMDTLGRDVAFGPKNLGIVEPELGERVKDALGLVSLRELIDAPTQTLSFGQKRRACMAGILAMSPDILVLDEPSSNLDPASKREFGELISSFEGTVVMVTHDLAFALGLCQRSILLANGSVISDAPTVEMLRDEATLHDNRLELPYGFDRRLLD